MTVLDWICAAILLIFCFFGLKRGLIGEFFRVAAVVIGLVGGFAFSSSLAEFFARFSPSLSFKGLQIFSFLILLGIFSGIAVLAGTFIRKVIRLTMLGWVDRLGGLLIGTLKGLLLIGFFLWVVSLLPSLRSSLDIESTIIAKHSSKTISLLWRLAHIWEIGDLPQHPDWRKRFNDKAASLHKLKDVGKSVNGLLHDSIARISRDSLQDSLQGLSGGIDTTGEALPDSNMVPGTDTVDQDTTVKTNTDTTKGEAL